MSNIEKLGKSREEGISSGNNAVGESLFSAEQIDHINFVEGEVSQLCFRDTAYIVTSGEPQLRNHHCVNLTSAIPLSGLRQVLRRFRRESGRERDVYIRRELKEGSEGRGVGYF